MQYTKHTIVPSASISEVLVHVIPILDELPLVVQALIDECSAVLAPMEKTFVCGDDYPCIGHKPDRQDSAKVSLHPVINVPGCLGGAYQQVLHTMCLITFDLRWNKKSSGAFRCPHQRAQAPVAHRGFCHGVTAPNSLVVPYFRDFKVLWPRLPAMVDVD